MEDDLIVKLRKIRGFRVIESDEQSMLVDVRDFGMDTRELIRRLREDGIVVHECDCGSGSDNGGDRGGDCIRIDSGSVNRELIDVLSSAISDWGQDLARRNIEAVIADGICVGRRDCEYYPCHFEGQDCTFCFCPFYPCGDTRTGGRYVESSTGRTVWSCVGCTIIHEHEVACEVLDGLMALEPGEDVSSVFRDVIVRHLRDRDAGTGAGTDAGAG